MPRVPFTLRIDLQERNALENLSKVERRPINQLLNEAIKSYLRKQGENERGLEANLVALRDYRKKDPGFRRAIAAFVEAEVTFDDSVEGKPVEGQFIAGQFRPAGPVQAKIRDLLGA